MNTEEEEEKKNHHTIFGKYCIIVLNVKNKPLLKLAFPIRSNQAFNYKVNVHEPTLLTFQWSACGHWNESEKEQPHVVRISDKDHQLCWN